jgi:TrkA domain protein
VDGGSACSGRRIGEIGLREDLGASIVALVRDGETIPSPPPDLTLREGDTAVAVGTPEGIRAMHALLQGD